MKKTAYFDRFTGDAWPTVAELEPFFIAPAGQQWSYKDGNDSWGLDVQGLYGTADLPRIERVNVHLYMTGHPKHGVQLLYDRWDGRTRNRSRYYSKGDLGRLNERAETLQQDLLPVGLFVPFDVAWTAVKEFIETDGELPKCIDWVASTALPPRVFPVPGEPMPT